MRARKKVARRVTKPRARAAEHVVIDGSPAEGGTGLLIPLAEYNRMTEVMKQLAMRDVKHEAAVMRIANAGGIAPVIEYVMMMRAYQKKHKK